MPHSLQTVTFRSCPGFVHIQQQHSGSLVSSRQWGMPVGGCSLILGGWVQRWVALQHFQRCHPEIKCEYSELFYVIGPDDPTLLGWYLVSNVACLQL